MMRRVRDFDELLDILMPWNGGVAVVLRAFFDASTRKTGTFCVAGLAFDADRAKKAERAWRSLMGERIAHLTDLHALHGVFAELTKDQSSELLKGQVKIIREHASFGVAISCDLNEVSKLLPVEAASGSEPLSNGFRKPYAVCCHLAMHTLGRMASQNGKGAGIAYVFEAGDQYNGESKKFIDHALAAGPMRSVYQCRSHGFLEKPDARLLETSDILAWEWAKHIDRLKEGKAARPSLRALIDGEVSGADYKSANYVAQHVTGARLDRFCDKVGRLLAATEHSEVTAIAASCSSDEAA